MKDRELRDYFGVVSSSQCIGLKRRGMIDELIQDATNARTKITCLESNLKFLEQEHRELRQQFHALLSHLNVNYHLVSEHYEVRKDHGA